MRKNTFGPVLTFFAYGYQTHEKFISYCGLRLEDTDLTGTQEDMNHLGKWL